MALPTLIVIDVQRALDDPIYGERSTPEAERNIARAIETWRERGAPLIHVRHASERLFRARRRDGGVQARGSAARRRAGRHEAREQRFETWVLADATAAHARHGADGELIPAETMHRTALASLDDEFAEVLGTDEALARAFAC